MTPAAARAWWAALKDEKSATAPAWCRMIGTRFLVHDSPGHRSSRRGAGIQSGRISRLVVKKIYGRIKVDGRECQHRAPAKTPPDR